MKETHRLYKVDNFILILKEFIIKVTHLMILLVLLNFECQKGGGGGSLHWLPTPLQWGDESYIYWKNIGRPLIVGMSSLFINLILKTSHYLHMKVLNERISEWVHLYFYHKRFSRYLHLKFEKEVIFLERFSPYEITESGDKISNFWVLKIAF